MTPVLRAVGCVRVSTSRQAEQGYSIEEQEAAIREYCERQNLILTELLVDRGVTGRAKQRPAITRMLQLADAKAFEVLVMVKVDRAGRENRIIQEIVGEARDRGLRVHFIEGGSGDTPEGRLILNVLGAQAEYNWEQLRAGTMAARRRKAQSGRIPVNVKLFGYHQITKAEAQVKPEYAGRDGHLEIVPEEAQWVPEIFRRADAGTGCHGLATWLNRAGVRTKQGNPFHQTVIRLLLQNRAYIGQFIYGKEQHRQTRELRASGKLKTTRTQTSPDEQILIPVPPLLVDAEGNPDMALFYRVQQRLEETRGAFHGRPSTLWPLRGVVFCGVCQTQDGTPRRCSGVRSSNEARRPGYAYRRYVCGSKANASLEYCGTAYSAEKLEAEARAALMAATEPGEMGRRARAYVEAQVAATEGAAGDVDQLRAELERLDDEERKIVDLALKGFSEHIIAERLAKVKQERSRVSTRLRALEEKAWASGSPDEAERQGETAAVRIRELLASEVPEDHQRVYQQAIRATLWKDRDPDVEVRIEAVLAIGIGGSLW